MRGGGALGGAARSSGKEEEPVRCADAGVRPGDQAEAASRRWRMEDR